MGIGIVIAAALAAALAFSGGKKKAGPVPAALPKTPQPTRILTPKKPGKPVKVVIPAHPAEPRAIARTVMNQKAASVRVAPVTSMPSEAQAGVMMARKQAQGIADMVRTRGAKYDRTRLAAWQSNAGLTPDGLYGPKTVDRLRQLGAKNVTGQMFKAKGK